MANREVLLGKNKQSIAKLTKEKSLMDQKFGILFSE